MNDLITVNKQMTSTIYNNLIKALDSKNVKVVRPELERLGEDYSYKILDNFKIDQIDEYIQEITSRGNTTTVNIGDIRKTTINSEWELQDTLYPAIRLGIAYEGTRRSRVTDTGISGTMKNELIEIDTTSLVPNIIYFLESNDFNPDNYYSQFTKEEIGDMEELFVCLLSKTINDVEEKRLKGYLLRDNVTEKFFWKVSQMNPKSPTKFKHPNILNNDIFVDADVLVESEMDILCAFIKSVLLIFTIHLLMRINNHNDSGNRFRMMIRSIAGYRILVERDLGCDFSATLRTKANILFEPKVTLLETKHGGE